MDCLLLFVTCLFLAISTSVGVNYFEIEELDKLYGKVTKTTSPKQTVSATSPPKQDSSNRPQNRPTPTPPTPSKPNGFPPPTPTPASKSTGFPPPTPPSKPNGFPPPTPTPTPPSKSNGFPPPKQNKKPLEFDFSSFEDVLNTSIDEDAFTELTRKR